MGLTGIARGLRRGPTLLLRAAPEPGRLLETVRLYAPQATVAGGVIRAGCGELRGPLEVTPGIARLARLPKGLPVAYLTRAQCGLMPGLAHRLGGLVFEGGRAAPGRDPEHHSMTVYLPVRPEPERFKALVGVYTDVVTHTEAPGMDLYSGGRFSALVRLATGHRPYALGALADSPQLLTCDLTEAATGSEPRLIDIALALAEEYDGVALDCDAYRLSSPDDLLPY